MSGQFDFTGVYASAPGLQQVNQMSVVDAFLWYNTHGYLALPAVADAKMLVLPKGYSFDKLKPPTEADLAAVRAGNWHPSWRVALIMSAPSKLCAVDVDDPDEWGRFCKEHKLPETAWQTTGRDGGGFHLLYRRLDHELMRQGPWSSAYPHIEIKSKGLIIAAPSPHASGRRYQWQVGPGEPAQITLAVLEQRSGEARDCPYRISGTGIVWDKPTQNGTAEMPLTNFTAKITGQAILDDGSGETRREFQIEAHARGRAATFTVPSSRFDGMTWVTEHLGVDALVWPGQGIKDHARFAIQTMSGHVPERRVYAHTGWRKMVDGSWAFLHAGGAIGARGTVPGIEVSLSGVLSRYALPDPPDGAELVAAIRASLSLARVAPGRIMAPLLGACYRAPLGSTTSSVMVVGPTGVRKTSVEVCVVQHYGLVPDAVDALKMLTSFKGTGNALEEDAFLAKDVLYVVDDLAPSGLSQAEAARMYSTAARILRAQANHCGKPRLRSDITRRPDRPPRGMVIASGEEAPRGHSVIARVMLLDVGGGDVNLAVLSEHQEPAAAASRAQFMAGYTRWLAARREGLGAAVSVRMAELRAKAWGSEVHGRLPETVASLMVGWEHALEFAVEAGALTAEQCSQHWQWAWNALGEAAQGQADRLAAAEPAGRFIRALASALSAGRAHIASRTGSTPPADPKRWGWRMREFATKEGPDFTWEPRGDCVGWIDASGVYLDTDAALAAADRLARETGEGLQISERTLMKALDKHGYLASTGTSGGRRELKVRISADGAGRPYVAHLPLGVFGG